MGYYLNQIEDFHDSYVDGRLVIDRFPPLIGIHPDLLINGNLETIRITVSFTASNGGATYRVIAQEGGLLIASCESSTLEVAHGTD